MDLIEHIVRYDLWCPKCEHHKEDETIDPCDDCLCNPVNTNTRQPTRFEEKKH